MSLVVACLVCARPLDSLLTSGLHAGVAVLAALVVLVGAAFARGALVVVRHDAAEADEHRPAPGAAS